MTAHRLTIGAVDFAKWLETQPNQARAAELLGVRQTYVSKVARGERVPRDHDTVETFRSVCGIEPDAWKRLSKRPLPPRIRSTPAPKAA